jgi:hypothetical protein
MRFLRYIGYAIPISGVLFLLLWIFLDAGQASDWVIVTLPLSIWTGRLITALRTGVITRRMPMLDGGPVMAGLFFSFTPEVYKRRPGFDYFKGYWFKEACVVLLLWLMFLGGPIHKILFGMGLVAR